MKFRIAAVGLCATAFAACSVNVADVADDPANQDAEDIVRGKTEKHVPQAVAVRVNGFGGGTLCSGTYIAKRVVITAAHCIRADAVPGQTYVYYGKDYLTDQASLPSIPAPGKKSSWARGETTVIHPDYSPGVNHPDLAIIFLDRELPFDPIPVERHRVSKWEKYGTIVGWGGSKALVPDISQVEGAGIKRSAVVRLLGDPTEADYHADDPNPGMLDPVIRHDVIKTDGRAPRANPCAGDSGGPLFIEEHGRMRLAGVGFWTGLSCEDYGMFSRMDPFLDYIDAETDRAGKADIVPRLECVEEHANGTFTARFGYQNDNGLTVNVPYGVRNSFPNDDHKDRPENFAPGDNAFAFGVDFKARESLKWTFSPKGGPTTVVRADTNSPRCAADDLAISCADACNNQLDAECSPDSMPFSQCSNDCKAFGEFFGYFGCVPAYNEYLACIEALPKASENWDCSFAGSAPTPLSPNCEAEYQNALVCAGYY